jgi:hypothetical protein
MAASDAYAHATGFPDWDMSKLEASEDIEVWEQLHLG